MSAAATRLVNGGARLKALLDDLLDFNRIKLGLGINIAPSAFDLADVLADELQQMRVAHRAGRLNSSSLATCAVSGTRTGCINCSATLF